MRARCASSAAGGGGGAVALGQPDRGGVDGVAGARVPLHQLDGSRVHQLDGVGQPVGGHQVADGRRGLPERAEAGQHGADGRRDRQQPQAGAGDDAERPLPADGEPADVEAGQVGGAAVQQVGDPVGVGELDGQHVLAHHAVGEDVDAAGVGGDVAAEGRGDLAGGVGREPQAVRRPRAAEAGVHEPRLDPGATVGHVELAQGVHPGDADDEGPHPSLPRRRGTPARPVPAARGVKGTP